MSHNRNKDTDRLATARVLDLTGQDQALALDTRPNWLKHYAKTAAIDKALILGTTMVELNEIGRNIGNHLVHLRVDHGLTIVEENGIFRLLNGTVKTLE